MLGNVVTQAGAEDISSDRGHELLQDTGPLGIRDAVELRQRSDGVMRAVAGNGMGGRPLIGDGAPILAIQTEVDPQRIVGVFGADLVGEIFGERLVEPQIVPPAHRDQVAEPLMGEFVDHCPGAGGALGPRGLAAEQERIAEGDAARVLHGPGVEVGDEGLVIVAEGVPLAENLVERVQPLFGDAQDVVGLGAEFGGERGPRVKAQPDAVMFIPGGGIGAGDDGDEIGGERRSLGHLPLPRARLGEPTVAEHGPVVRGRNAHCVGRFQVGLVETREPARPRVEERHRIEIGLVVGRVDVTMQALTVVRIGHLAGQCQRVDPGCRRERQATGHEQVRIHVLAIEIGVQELIGSELDKGRRAGFGGNELDRRRRGEGGGVPEIEFDRDPFDAEAVEPLTRLGTIERRHGVTVSRSATHQWGCAQSGCRRN